jgi:hypothetical protein
MNLTHKISLKCRTPYLLSVVVLGTAFFMNPVMADNGSTAIKGLSDDKAAKPVVQSITATPTAECPLNSGGPSLLGTTWRLDSIYGNRVPSSLKIDMRVSTTSLSGSGGCNKYSANFNQVGYTGFSVKSITKTKKICEVIIPYRAAKSINVGSWEGSYFRTLKRMGSVRQMTDSQLYFFNRNGQIGMKFRKTGDEQQEAAAAAKKAAEIVAAQEAAEAAKKTAEMAAKKEAEQDAMTKKKPSVEVSDAIQNTSEEQPVVKKTDASDDDLITQFFKSVGL